MDQLFGGAGDKIDHCRLIKILSFFFEAVTFQHLMCQQVGIYKIDKAPDDGRSEKTFD